MPSVAANHGVSQNGLPITCWPRRGPRRGLVGIEHVAVLVEQP